MKVQRNIRALLVEPNELPKEVFIKNSLEAKQKLVGGNIEYTSREYYSDVIFICNEEGKILGLPLNRDIGGDIIAGSFLIVGDDPEIGEDRSLTDDQIKKYQDVFNEKSIEDTNLHVAQIYLGKQADLTM